MFSLICVWINGWVNNREAGDLRRYRAHFDVSVMWKINLFTVVISKWACTYTIPIWRLVCQNHVSRTGTSTWITYHRYCGMYLFLAFIPASSTQVLIHHDDVIEWEHFPRDWPFVRGIQRSPVNSPHKGQSREALMFSLICAWINGWLNNGEAGDLRRYRAHYDVTVMRIYCVASDEELAIQRILVNCLGFQVNQISRGGSKIGWSSWLIHLLIKDSKYG